MRAYGSIENNSNRVTAHTHKSSIKISWHKRFISLAIVAMWPHSFVNELACNMYASDMNMSLAGKVFQRCIEEISQTGGRERWWKCMKWVKPLTSCHAVRLIHIATATSVRKPLVVLRWQLCTHKIALPRSCPHLSFLCSPFLLIFAIGIAITILSPFRPGIFSLNHW